MEFHIAHLYYDILNLYGEHGNITAIKRSLESQGIEPIVHFLTLEDEIDFNKFDLIYIGAGTEENQKIVLSDLLRYQNEIKECYENGTHFLVTGNAVNFFGTMLKTEEKDLACLGLFSYHVIEEKIRMMDECYFTCDFIKTPLIGFQNQCTVMKENEHTMFTVHRGIGMYPNSTREGIHRKNFYGTYLIGPVMIRNPEFLKYFVTEMIQKKYPDVVFQPFDLELDERAHQNYIDRYFKNMEKESRENG